MKVGRSLRTIINELKALQVNVPSVVIFRRLERKNSPWVQLERKSYAYYNKYYDLLKSTDGTGFYYKWEWEPKSPFEQKPRKENPISKNSYTAHEIDVILPKTKWQKFKSFISNLFN
jgi:hypothetical protein